MTTAEQNTQFQDSARKMLSSDRLIPSFFIPAGGLSHGLELIICLFRFSSLLRQSVVWAAVILFVATLNRSLALILGQITDQLHRMAVSRTTVLLM